MNACRCSPRCWLPLSCWHRELLSQTTETLEDVVLRRDVDYLSGRDYADDKDKLDLYMPEGANGVPVIVFFQGGGLWFGDKNDGEAFAMRFARQQIGVVSANYRLSPSVMHPAHVEDATAAVAWVIENIAQFGGDSGRVFAAGHSAGAYLVTLMTLDPAYLAAHRLGPDAIRATIPISPFLYVEETAKDRPKFVWGDDPAAWLRASVTPHIGPAKGQMLFIYADGDDDWRKRQIETFGQAMRNAGSKQIRVVQVPGRDHLTLISGINAADDQIGALVLKLIEGQ